ncbi:HNH endonuclease signature motif containing protein [Microbacterium pseudoresistens]|uniref:HNH nuclease domain-containing protein n=2 Tax=Microbacterium pseudoresistens TaxID=640634 RepID=A0A7Y9ETE2_9MICO|nr:HNH endonuclease signature motif containing protein [Microbacterium pseudoresistens]NYD53624.1 hypothetical protein [Microbacterium pseudoresistens]
MTDAEVVAVLSEAAEVSRHVEQIRLAAAGVIAARSTRDAGHNGLAQSRGHRSPTALVQELTGTTKAEAARQVRVGVELLDAAPEPDSTAEGGESSLPAELIQTPWHEPLRQALRAGEISSTAYDAIRRGLGEPATANPKIDADARVAFDDETREAWRQAAEQLIGEAAERTVEELRIAAQSVRDMLDPEGAEARFLARFEKRSFRTYIDDIGMRRASIVFDDEGAAFVESIRAAALRPRRGGPRFVDPDEKSRAAELVDDPRTNDQLSYDLVLDVIRAGVLAEPEQVFGTRQAGLRLVQVIDTAGRRAPVAHTEDDLVTVPAAVADRRACDAGTVNVTLDASGNPLDVGREHRLFTTRQRIALAVRDGGCRWKGCDRPASYCEAHHIDEWERDGGRTDIDRGILLCRYHHMTLHHGGWRITRNGTDDFILHNAESERTVLVPRAALRYAWGDIDPPPRRLRPAAA